MHYRRNIDCLTADELHNLREALAVMFALPASDPTSFARIASFHGGPPIAYCRHGSPGLFTWHRAYLMAFESALRTIGCNVLVPFWDWSSGPSTGVPQACRLPTYVNRAGATKPNPLYSGPRATGGQTSRNGAIDTTDFGPHATSAQAALNATAFTSFQNQIDSVHGWVHVTVGGDMGSVPTAAYDPIFYLHHLHHANIDRLWAQWQASHPGSLPPSEASLALQPFSRPFSTQWQIGSDVESTDALGYRYQKFCYRFPKIPLWEAVLIDWPDELRKQVTSVRLLVKSDRMQATSMELRAFVDQPLATGQTKTLGNPAFAGAVGFLGHGEGRRVGTSAEMCAECAKLGNTLEHAQHVHADEVCAECARLGSTAEHAQHVHAEGDQTLHDQGVDERFDMELDITASLRAAERDSEQVSLKLVAVDLNGDEVAAKDIVLEDIDIIVE